MWIKASFQVAQDDGVVTVEGMTQGGLGLQLVRKFVPIGPPPVTRIIHLGSGHQIALIEADFGIAGKFAAELLSCGDWDFDGLDGWQNRDPDLPAKKAAVMTKYAQYLLTPAKQEADARKARQIARERA